MEFQHLYFRLHIIIIIVYLLIFFKLTTRKHLAEIWAILFPTHHRHREADSNHDNVMKHHEKLSPQVAANHRADFWCILLMTFDLYLVPVAQEHGVDVIDKVRDGKQDVGASEPVPVDKEDKPQEEKKWGGGRQIAMSVMSVTQFNALLRFE